MYEIWKNERTVNEVDITTFCRDIDGVNVLEVEAGTNGPKGINIEYGCRTYLRITDQACTDMEVKVLGEDDGITGFEVSLSGDSELRTFIEALKFAVQVLEDMEKGDWE